MFNISEKTKKQLLDIARNSLELYLKGSKNDKINRVIDELNFESGVFVTLKNKNELRGCIGRMESNKNIVSLTIEMAIASASRDYRFKPVDKNELDKIEIEISVLSPKIKILSIDEIDVSRHGIYIQSGNRSGTFLPQVARETGWDKEELLSRCSRDKAGLGWNGWKNADIYIYEVISFCESDYK